MIKSMTGYGRSESVVDDRRYTVELKSVNHRYLEISLRMPSMISPLEVEIKKKLGEQFSRGRIEVTVRLDVNNGTDVGTKYELNIPLMKNYYEMLTQLKREFNLQDEITLGTMTGFRDAFVQSEQRLDIAVIGAELSRVMDEAIIELKEMRLKEGENLCADITSRIRSIEHSLDTVCSRAPQVVEEYQKRLTERIKELTMGVGVDEIRLHQEVAIMAEKSDITEEMVRMRSHIQQFDDLLKSDEPMGRKIDFLIQEMTREVNTTGSKSGDLEISKNIVEMKSELAKLREQVQNIE